MMRPTWYVYVSLSSVFFWVMIDIRYGIGIWALLHNFVGVDDLIFRYPWYVYVLPVEMGHYDTDKQWGLNIKNPIMMTSSYGNIFRVTGWPLVWGIHRSPVNSPHKGQWRRALMFSLIWAWTNSWANNREACDLRRQRAHYDVTVMIPQTTFSCAFSLTKCFVFWLPVERRHCLMVSMRRAPSGHYLWKRIGVMVCKKIGTS